MAKFTKWVEAAADEPLVDVAVRSLASRLEPLTAFIPLAANSPEKDPEYVHQMRVWSRRATAALQMYEELLPRRRRKWMLRQARAIRRAANDARDDDVMIQRLSAEASDPHAAALLKQVREHRRHSQQPIVALWEDLMANGKLVRRTARLLDKVRLRGEMAEAGAVPFGPWATFQIRRVLERFFDAGSADLTDLAALHRFRIAGKKLRYTVELLVPAFPDTLRTQAYPAIQELQERLGGINDLATARARLERWIKQADDPENAAYLQAMLNQQHEPLEQRRQEFVVWWTGGRQAELRQMLSVAVQPAAVRSENA